MRATFAFYPAVATVCTSLFSRGTRRSPSEFTGPENDARLFDAPTFREVAVNDILCAAVRIPIPISIALALGAPGELEDPRAGHPVGLRVRKLRKDPR